MHEQLLNYLLISFKFLFLLFLPGIFWLYFFAGEKKIFNSNITGLFPVFLMGIFVCIPAIAIEYFCVLITKIIQNEITVLVSSFLIIGPLEEYLKALAVNISGYSRKEESGPKQILAWYFAAAIGFASIENVLYFVVFGSRIFIYRVLITTLAHVCCSGIVGLFVGRYLNTDISGFARGFFVAMIIHGAYDYSLNVYPKALWFWVPFFLLLCSYFESKLDNTPHIEVVDPEEAEDKF